MWQGPDLEYAFPAVRGVQAGRVFFVSTCPLRVVAKLFVYDSEELQADLRAQRALNKGRLPELVRYMVDNPTSYVFSALTVSIDGAAYFSSLPGTDLRTSPLGTLHVAMNARFVINDGQHRRAAICEAIRQAPRLADETIGVVFFLDAGLERCQQMFADLNRHAVRPSTSLGVLYDRRDADGQLARLLALEHPIFRGFVDMESSSLPKASGKLFTLSALYGATRTLLHGLDDLNHDQRRAIAFDYWAVIGSLMSGWAQVREQRFRSSDLRAQFIHSHGIALAAFGRIGNTIIRETRDPVAWRDTLSALATVDWSRSNPLWEGRALVGGSVSKARTNLLLTTAAIRRHLGLALPPDEEQAEQKLTEARSEQRKGTA
ncbi:DNA sulfur modification protein DndB [Candidatus Protofrankia californiensis]|uniref:DNA sulfur modification protein DndB n=1 Tax=Candidatus Protofrankia californiensis TaxID=1839754 RepID=UPI001040F9A4|nr:DNA sulfur modification protein DndB [Candidatus Protofrankia californiensis]